MLLPGLEPTVTLYRFEVDGQTLEIRLTGEYRNARYKATLKARMEAIGRGLQGQLRPSPQPAISLK